MNYTEIEVFNGVKIVKDLEEAGMERRLADAMVGALTETIGYVLVVVRLDLDKLRAELRQDNAEFQARMQQQMDGFKADVKQDNAEFQARMQRQMGDFQTGVRQDNADLRLEVKQDNANLRVEMHKALNRNFILTVTTIAALLAAYEILVHLLGR